MADYNIINDTETDPEAPLRSSLFKRMVANPIAIAEGAGGAPRIEDAALDSTVTSDGETWVADRMIARTHGGVGTLAFATRTGAVAFGSSVLGSSLTPCNAAGTPSGSPLTGTWRCLGAAANGGGEAGAAIWQRIA